MALPLVKNIQFSVNIVTKNPLSRIIRHPAHLSRKHPNEDQNDRTGKGGQSLLTFFPKRSRSSDDAVSKNKKKNCSGSGDSAIELEDRELEEDFGSTNLAPVNVSNEDADDVQQQSSSKAGGAGLHTWTSRGTAPRFRKYMYLKKPLAYVIKSLPHPPVLFN